MLPIRAILHPTDFSEHSEHAFRLACSLARDHGARLIILHVWSVPTAMLFGEVLPDPDSVTSRAEVEVELYNYRPLDPNVLVEHVLMEGDPAATILQVADGSMIDLIVMGTHGRRGLRRLLMGSVAENVVRRATCPVVTVKNPFPETEPIREVERAASEAPLQEMVTG